jgi:hypothetical protein
VVHWEVELGRVGVQRGRVLELQGQPAARRALWEGCLRGPWWKVVWGRSLTGSVLPVPTKPWLPHWHKVLLVGALSSQQMSPSPGSQPATGVVAGPWPSRDFHLKV